jgi:hypothetical protein
VLLALLTIYHTRFSPLLSSRPSLSSLSLSSVVSLLLSSSSTSFLPHSLAMALQGCLTLEQLLTDISRTNPGTLDPSLLTDAFNKSPFDSTPLTFSQRLSAETGPHFDKIREHQEALVAFQYLCGEKARGVAFQYLCGEKARGIMAQSGSAWEEKKVWEGIAEKMGKELKKDVPGLATNYRALTERIKTRTDVEEAIGVKSYLAISCSPSGAPFKGGQVQEMVLSRRRRRNRRRGGRS